MKKLLFIIYALTFTGSILPIDIIVTNSTTGDIDVYQANMEIHLGQVGINNTNNIVIPDNIQSIAFFCQSCAEGDGKISFDANVEAGKTYTITEDRFGLIFEVSD